MNQVSKRIIIILLVSAGCSQAIRKEEYCQEYILQSQSAMDSLSKQLNSTLELLETETRRANLHSELYMELKMKCDD